jgi:hypothetical protein
MRLGVLFGNVGHADTVERGTDDDLDIVDDQRAAHGDGQRQFPLIKLPSVTRLAIRVESSAAGRIVVVRKRAHPSQRYFESGFPHGVHEYISAAATHWAMLALIAAQ